MNNSVLPPSKSIQLPDSNRIISIRGNQAVYQFVSTYFFLLLLYQENGARAYFCNVSHTRIFYKSIFDVNMVSSITGLPLFSKAVLHSR